jgi:hypothetical protein
VPEADGQWVTSRDTNTRYYAPKASSYWKRWVAGNRVWFRSLEELLRAYPGRVVAPD